MLAFLRKSFFELEPPAFGVDLSELSIKMIKLRRQGKYLGLETFNGAAIPPGLIVDGEIIEIPKLGEIIKSCLKTSTRRGLGPGYVIASLPEEKSFIRLIQLPKVEVREAQEAVRYEAENSIPVSLEEVYLDWQIIPPLFNHLDHFDILIVATPRNIIDSYVSCLRRVGLAARAFEVESIAISRSVIAGGVSQEPVLIIDFGETRTSFIIFSGYTLRFTSSIEISGRSLTEAISRELKVDYGEAERLKQEIGLSRKTDAPKVFDAIIPILTDLKEQIYSYTVFYQEHAAHEHRKLGTPPLGITKIFLTGGGAALKGLDRYLAVELKMQVERANPWANILHPPLKEVPELPYESSLGYTTALGLALRGIERY